MEWVDRAVHNPMSPALELVRAEVEAVDCRSSEERRKGPGRRSADLDVNEQVAIAQAFVELGDARDADATTRLTVLFEACRKILVSSDIGVVLCEEGEVPRRIVASSEAVEIVEDFELGRGEGPLFVVIDSDLEMVELDLEPMNGSWSQFGALCRAVGYRELYEIPMRTDSATLGVLEIYRRDATPLPMERIRWAAALAHATASSVQLQRSNARLAELSEQLQRALVSRVGIEQAKGIVASQLGIDVDEAFLLLRRYSRNHGRRLHEIADDVVRKALPVIELRRVGTGFRG